MEGHEKSSWLERRVQVEDQLRVMKSTNVEKTVFALYSARV